MFEQIAITIKCLAFTFSPLMLTSRPCVVNITHPYVKGKFRCVFGPNLFYIISFYVEKSIDTGPLTDSLCRLSQVCIVSFATRHSNLHGTLSPQIVSAYRVCNCNHWNIDMWIQLRTCSTLSISTVGSPWCYLLGTFHSTNHVVCVFESPYSYSYS